MATAIKPPAAPVDTALADLASLGAALAEKAGDAVASARIKDEILDQIGALDTDTAKALLKDPRIARLLEVLDDEKAQNVADRPGTITNGFIGGTKVSGFNKRDWTEADLAADRIGGGKFVTFTPTETVPLFYQGLRRQMIADEEVTIEKAFYDVYMEHRRLQKLVKEQQEFLFRKRDTVTDASMVTAEGARARGMGETGWFVPGGGSIITATTTPPKAGEAAGEEASA